MKLGDKSIKPEKKILRLYPQKNLFSHLVGQIDSDNIGISGIEKSQKFLLLETKKLEKKDFGENESSFPIQFKGGGLHLSYNIRTKLWLSVGLRRTIGGFENIFVDKLIYDKSGEYIDNEGNETMEADVLYNW